MGGTFDMTTLNRGRGLTYVLMFLMAGWGVAVACSYTSSLQAYPMKTGPSQVLAMHAGAMSKDQDVPLGNLTFRNIGPAVGGRVCRVTGVPGQPLIYYAATASGGVWKSVDGGIHWDPIFDDQPTSTCGSIAVAPSAPHVLYVGSGEANIRGNVMPGNGIYKSTDAGRTWKHVWKQKGQIGTLIVHPQNPDVAFAAVLGHISGPNGERGVFRTKDGGKTWKRVLFVDANTGASDVCFDPSNPTILFAGMWQTRRMPWQLTSGGPGSSLHVSRDGGDTWEKLTGNGLPDGIWGRVGVAVAPSDGDRVYALIEAEEGGLFRSDDGGKTWQRINDDRRLRQRAWYYSTLTIDPKNADVLYCPQVSLLKSIDGGKSFESFGGRGFYHGDNHDLWVDPHNAKRMIVGNDGGVNVTTNGGKQWFAPCLPISQFYRIAADHRLPYHVSGTMQDIGCAAAPSNSLSSGGIRLADWYSVGGGETGYVVHDPSDPNIVYAGEYMGIITRFDGRTRTARHVGILPDNASGHGAEAMKYRFRWPAPIAGSPHDPKVIYHGGNILFRTADGGQSWKAISPDLTRNDKSKQQWSGGPITGDNTSAEFYCTISAVVESPKAKGVIWVGSDDGLLHLTRDGGKTWKNLTERLPEFPEWATVTSIEASPSDAGTAYVVIEAHLLDIDRPYLFKTTDFGETWTTLSKEIPQDVYLHVVREDPANPNILYLGTERGLMMSLNGGIQWQPLKLNLPTVPVHDLIVKNNDLVVGTNGRSMWILDDLTPIRQWSSAIAAKPVHLFPCQPAIRWNIASSFGWHEMANFPNPPYGAVLHYHLKEDAAGPVRIEVRDEEDNLVAKLRGGDPKPPMGDEEDEEGTDDAEDEPEVSRKAGLHRVVWDLSYDGAKPIQNAVIDMGNVQAGPKVNPGVYHVHLIVGEETIVAPVEVKPDPRRPIKPADLDAQRALALQMRKQINQLSETVHLLRSVKEQLERRNELLKHDGEADRFREQSQNLIDKLDRLEERLHNPKAKIAYDILAFKGGAKLYSRFGFLYSFLVDGDGAPTQGAKEVHAELTKELKSCMAEWKRLTENDLQALNRQAKRKDWPVVLIPKQKTADR